ncbi:MAG: rRNA maturation RNase YbeY [Lachnospiraceae bacterium]|nr:rRNA maturation RNase YbeY [Lachnospiraceae bacterium]
MTVYYENESGITFDFPVQEQLEALVACVAETVGCPEEVEVNTTVVEKKEIHRMNREFRQVDRPTDVLSFPMMEYDAPADFAGEAFQSTKTVSPESGELLLGDIVLCADVVCSQAEEYGHSIRREFSFLVVHSMLHLFGYDHMEEGERLAMETLQRQIMEKVKINR